MSSTMSMKASSTFYSASHLFWWSKNNPERQCLGSVHCHGTVYGYGIRFYAINCTIHRLSWYLWFWVSAISILGGHPISNTSWLVSQTTLQIPDLILQFILLITDGTNWFWSGIVQAELTHKHAGQLWLYFLSQLTFMVWLWDLYYGDHTNHQEWYGRHTQKAYVR